MQREIRAPKRRCPINFTGHVATRIRVQQKNRVPPKVTPFQLGQRRAYFTGRKLRLQQKNRVPPKVAPFQLGRSRVYLMEQQPRFHPKRCIPTESAYNPCVYRTCIQSLLLQFSSTVRWHKQMTVYPWFKVHQQQTQSTGEV